MEGIGKNGLKFSKFDPGEEVFPYDSATFLASFDRI